MQDSNPLVSVVIPTKNRADFLIRAIKSVLVQQIQDYEILVISDGSTDDTESAVTALGEDRIRFFKHEVSKGASAARNLGLRHARGQYIAFLDDDDEWTRDKLEVQLPVIQQSADSVGLVYAWMEYYRDGQAFDIWAPKIKGDVFVEMLDKQAIGGCPTIIIKRSIIDKVGYFDENLLRGNDGNYWRRISRHYQVDFIPKVLAKVHVGHVQITGYSCQSIRYEVIALLNRLAIFEEEFEKHPTQKHNILVLVAMDYLLIGNIIQALAHFWKAWQCEIPFCQKMTHIRLNFRKAAGKLKSRLMKR